MTYELFLLKKNSAKRSADVQFTKYRVLVDLDFGNNEDFGKKKKLNQSLISQLPHICVRFFKFYIQAICHSHCIQRGFDISKCNHNCVCHLHFFVIFIYIYILIKTEQISNATCKLILVLSVSVMLLGVVAQPLFTIDVYDKNCLVTTACF